MNRFTWLTVLALAAGCQNPSLTGVESNTSLLTVFSPATTPANTNVSSGFDLELGAIFFSDVDGTVNGVHFYKGTQDTGTHTGHLWTSTGTLLATVTFTGETASGWQFMAFSSPVNIFAGTRYVISYHTTTGFSWNPNYFTAQVDAAPLHIPVSGGVYTLGTNPSFPTTVYQNSNYWVDVDFTAGGGGSNTTLFDNAQAPASEATNTDPTELGIKFNVDTTGSVTKIRFYKTANDTGVHVGHLWDQSGTLLASANFTGETASGWQETAVSAKVAPGKTYTASYSTSTSFGFDNGSLMSTIDRPPLHAPTSAGVYGVSGSYPQGNFYSDNFWVDIGFAAAACTPTCTVCGASDGCGSVCCTGSSYSVWAVSDGPPGSGFIGSVDYELGTKFSSTVPGTITHLRFFKEQSDNGGKTGHLWGPGGNLLATAVFPGGGSGWKDVTLPSPVPITPNQTYTVSYQTTTGFAYTSSYFTTARNALPLTVPANGGVFNNGGTFPTQSFSGTSYWADVVFVPTPALSSLF